MIHHLLNAAGVPEAQHIAACRELIFAALGAWTLLMLALACWPRRDRKTARRTMRMT